MYNRGIGANLALKIREHKQALLPLEKEFGINLEECCNQIKGMRDFDTCLTTRIHGYRTSDNYYRSASLGQRLKDIRIPTLLMSPLDDPVMPY